MLSSVLTKLVKRNFIPQVNSIVRAMASEISQDMENMR